MVKQHTFRIHFNDGTYILRGAADRSDAIKQGAAYLDDFGITKASICVTRVVCADIVRK